MRWRDRRIEKELETRAKLEGLAERGRDWHRVFAWFPTSIPGYALRWWVWLEHYERRYPSATLVWCPYRRIWVIDWGREERRSVVAD